MKHEHVPGTRFTVSRIVFPLLLCALLVPYAVASSDSYIRIVSAETRMVDEVYQLDAIVNYVFDASVRDALKNGVALVFEMNIEVQQERGWWWNEQVASLEQRYKLGYHALSRQYVTVNVNAGSQQTFPDLQSALEYLGLIENLPLLDAALLTPDSDYVVRARVRLVLDELPLPLRARGYVSSAWRLASDWYTWPMP